MLSHLSPFWIEELGSVFQTKRFLELSGLDIFLKGLNHTHTWDTERGGREQRGEKMEEGGEKRKERGEKRGKRDYDK